MRKNLLNAFMHAEGKYIYPMSGDDWLNTNDVFERHVYFLESHTNFQMVTNWLNIVNKRGRLISKSHPDYDCYTMEDLLAHTPTGVHLGTFRNIFYGNKAEFSYLHEGNFSRNNEELLLWSYLLERGSMGIIRDYLKTYRFVCGKEYDNYNSTHTCVEMFEDYYKQCQVLISIKGNKYNFMTLKLSICDEFLERLMKNNDIYGLIKYISIISMTDFIETLLFRIIKKVNNNTIPRFMITSEFLVKKYK